MAVIVNGDGIPVAEFKAELTRYQSAQSRLGNTPTPETDTESVMNDLIDQLLLSQGAVAAGFAMDDAALQTRIDNLTAQVGGPDALAAWEIAHEYTDADFRSALRRQISGAWMRDRIINAIPGTAEQVHIRQILFYNADKAQAALVQLQSGAAFATLAAQFDPVTQGELGWFPRGYLPEPAFEDAAFSLQPGQYSGIIQTVAGYHIIFVVDRDPNHPLSPDALLTLQDKALKDWLRQQRAKSTITTAH